MECTVTRLLKDGDRVCGAFAYRRGDGRVRRLHGAGGRPRDRRRREVLAGHVELVGVHRRRARARLRGGRRARRHGVRPVPPDRHGLAARRRRPARHRGGSRRGRDPAQRGRRAVHGALRPEAAGALDPRRRRAGDLHRGEGGPRHAPRRRLPRRLAPAGGGGAGRSCRACTRSSWSSPASTSRSEPMEVGPTCHYFMGGIVVDAETGATTVPGLFAAGECTGGMNGCEPPRRQLALRPARVRQAGGRGGGAVRSRGAAPPAPRTPTMRGRRPRRDDAATSPARATEDPYALQAELQETMEERCRHLPRPRGADQRRRPSSTS